MSEKRRRESRVYTKLRKQFLEENPICELEYCFKPSVDLHHRHGRTGTNYLDTETWSALCRDHHDNVHAHPNEARKAGLLA